MKSGKCQFIVSLIIFERHTPILLRFTLYLLCFFLLQQVAAQQEKQYSFKHFGATEGLASNEATAVTQDDQGYIWIGSNNGLQRFDGTRYKTFRNQKNNAFSIPHNYVLDILIDKKNNLWILTGDGKVGTFDRKTFRYSEVKVIVKNENVLRLQRKLIEDEEGNLFLSFFNTEFLTWNEKNREFSATYNFIFFPPDIRIVDFKQQPGTKKYWISTQKGMAIFNRQTNQLSYTGHNEGKEGFIDKLGTIPSPGNIFFDKQNRVWFVYWKGGPTIFLYDLKKNEKILDQYSLPIIGTYHEVSGFLQQKDGSIWLKGLTVLAKYQEKEKRFQHVSSGFHNEKGIEYDMVNSLFEDRERNIWIATNSNGLYRFDPASQFFTNIPHINYETGLQGKGSILSFLERPNGELIAGSWADGLFRYDTNYNSIPVNMPGLLKAKGIPWVWSMTYSKDSNIVWMSAQPGVHETNLRTRSSVFHNPAIFQNRTIRQIAADRQGNLWMGGQDIGLFKWTADKGKKKWDDGVTRFKDIAPTTIFKLFVDNKGLLWVCTAISGVYVIDPATDRIIEHLGAKEAEGKKLLWDAVATALQYDDSTVAIFAQGIHFYNTNQHRITKSIKIPNSISSNLCSAERDKNGYIWISTSNGLLRLNPYNEIFIHFDRVDGISNDRFVTAASHVRKNGKLLFGADDQIVEFDPGMVKINDEAPAVSVTGFKVVNNSLLVDSLLQYKQIELPSDKNSITIEFSALHYHGTYIIKYKMNNLDKDWIIADASNQAVYSYLPPGTYTFSIRTEDAEGKTGASETKLLIHINPPFWRTWWFYCFLALLAATLLYWIDRDRMKRLKELQRVRSQIASNLHEKVNSTLNNINLLSEMAKIKADKDIERSKEYIDQISTKSHNMIIAMDDILWSINPENDSMEKTLLRMMEYADALKNRYGANIELALDRKVRSVNLDMKTRHEFFLLFKEALRMIVQYSRGKDTLVNIDLFQSKLSMKLHDETASFDANISEVERSIKEMNTRAALIPAELDIQYDKKGIAVILMVPTK